MAKLNRLTPVPFVKFLLNKYSRPGYLSLDAGCGPALYKNTVNGKCIGLDINDNSYVHLTGNKRMDIVASAMSMPFKSNTFDLVFSKSAFFQFDNHELALLEFRRVLKPGGRLLLIDYNKTTQRILEIKEKAKRPCWTQWELKKMVEKRGFKNSEILLPISREAWAIEKNIRLLLEEVIGLWAIVTAVK